LFFDCESSGVSFNLDTYLSSYIRIQRNLPTTASGIVPSHILLACIPKWELDINKMNKCKDSHENKSKESEAVENNLVNKNCSCKHSKILVKRISKHLYKIMIRFKDRVAHVNQLQKRHFRLYNRPFIEVYGDEPKDEDNYDPEVPVTHLQNCENPRKRLRDYDQVPSITRRSKRNKR
jgi:hypothetical protein